METAEILTEAIQNAAPPLNSGDGHLEELGSKSC